MQVQYLSILTTVNNSSKTDYTVVEGQNDNFKSFIMDRVDFNKTTPHKDDLLTYSELSELNLSPNFNVKTNTFEFQKGLGLLSQNLNKPIFEQSGISLELLEENLKELDKDKNNKITTNEIDPHLTTLIDTQKRDYRAFKMQNLHQKIDDNKKISNENKQIASLNKQIESLQKILQSFKTQEAVSHSNANESSTHDIASAGIDKKLETTKLKAKYGEDDITKLINTISRSTNPTKNITKITYQSGTKASEQEVASLANLMEKTLRDNARKPNKRL